jgi:hypothetical protein
LNKVIVYVFIVFMLIFCSCAGATTTPIAQASEIGYSLSRAAPVGLAVKGIIECGAGYTSHELYDIKVTVLEVARGDKASGLIKGSNTSPATSVNLEYILARIRFEYFARGAPGDCCHQLTPAQFIGFSEEGREYEPASVAPPTPELRGTVCAGNFLEGWVVFQVSKGDKKPVATFSAGVGGIEAIEHGGNIWLQLY